MSEKRNEDLWKRIHRVVAEMEKASGKGPVDDHKAFLRKLKKRAEELARPADDREGRLAEEENLLLMKVGKEEYALRLGAVEEIMRLPPITPVPCVPEHFTGVINRRGNILPLIDLQHVFTEKRSKNNPDSRVVVITRHNLYLGLQVDAADKIITVPSKEIKPPLKKGGGTQEEFCTGVVTLGKRMLVLIDSDRLLQDDRMKVDKGV